NTDRVLLNIESDLILPGKNDGSGVDRMVVTFSAGPALQIVTLGLLPEVSLESASRMASTTYGQVAEFIGLTDNRRPEVQLDAILRAEPDLIILAGGTNNGADQSVLKMVDLIALACRVLPKGKKPSVFYAGNPALAQKVKESLDRLTPVYIAPNVRPHIDREDVFNGAEALAAAVSQMRTQQLKGLEELGRKSPIPPQPGSSTFGSLIRFFSQVYDPMKGVLGVDMGASWTTVATAFDGKLSFNTQPVGMGRGLKNFMRQVPLVDIMQWLPIDIPADVVRDYLWQKSLYPASIPMTDETLAIEQSAARQMLYTSISSLVQHSDGRGWYFEPIFVAGSTLTHAPTSAQTLLMLLDGIQPLGITSLLLDPHGLTTSLGAIAQFNSLLPVQVVESSAYFNLATVISPLSGEKFGSPILNVRMELSGGSESSYTVKQGSLVMLPLQPGQKAKVYFEPLRRLTIDPRNWKKGFDIYGGICGAVIDARGRPLQLPRDDVHRRELHIRWAEALKMA
ncbi:MAG TPA: glutamate mutase L, partial [Longilinea sp.]|nr:glutamate mutase L [Longilinea sp.]